MKYLIFTIASIFLLVGCSTNEDSPPLFDDTSTTNGGVNTVAATSTDIGNTDAGSTEDQLYSCPGDKPTNVDGYYSSYFSPQLLRQVPHRSNKFFQLEHVVGTVTPSEFRIGVSASYNLGNSEPLVISAPKHGQAIAQRATCNTPSRISVGPILTSLEITADQPIGADYPAGRVLNTAFSITPSLFGYDINYPPTQAAAPTIVQLDTDYLSLDDYQSSEPLAPMTFLLRLNARPVIDRQYIFTITYTLSSGMSGSIQTDGVSFE